MWPTPISSWLTYGVANTQVLQPGRMMMMVLGRVLKYQNQQPTCMYTYNHHPLCFLERNCIAANRRWPAAVRSESWLRFGNISPCVIHQISEPRMTNGDKASSSKRSRNRISDSLCHRRHEGKPRILSCLVVSLSSNADPHPGQSLLVKGRRCKSERKPTPVKIFTLKKQGLNLLQLVPSSRRDVL